MIKLIDHIGIAVHDIDSSLKIYQETLGIELLMIEVIDFYKLKIAFLLVGDTLVELLQPLAEGTRVGDVLKEKGECIDHIAFRVDDLKAELAKLKALGIPLMDETPQPGGNGAQIAFLHQSAANNVLIELVETKEDAQNG